MLRLIYRETDRGFPLMQPPGNIHMNVGFGLASETRVATQDLLAEELEDFLSRRRVQVLGLEVIEDPDKGLNFKDKIQDYCVVVSPDRNLVSFYTPDDHQGGAAVCVCTVLYKLGEYNYPKLGGRRGPFHPEWRKGKFTKHAILVSAKSAIEQHNKAFPLKKSKAKKAPKKKAESREQCR